MNDGSAEDFKTQLVSFIANILAEGASSCVFISYHDLIHTVLVSGWYQETLLAKHVKEWTDFVKSIWILTEPLIVIEMNITA